MEETIELALTKRQIASIIVAYEQLREKTPFFAFNEETRFLIEHLKQRLLEAA